MTSLACGEHLKSVDLSKDVVYCLEQVRLFNLETFNKATDTIESFSQRLISYQLKLQDTEYKLSDTVMVMRLCLGMPADPDWAVTRLTVLRDNRTFLQAVAQYQVAERLRPTATAATNSNPATAESANTANNTYNGGGNRVNKCRYRGGSYRGKSSHSRSGRNSSNADATDTDGRCNWCLRKGHIKKECRDYTRAMEKARQGRTREQGDKVKETANVAICYSRSSSPSPRVEEIEDISAYTSKEISACSSTTLSTNCTGWILDSRASKHMCGDRTLFISLKRLATPWLIKLADSTLISAFGRGLIRLQSSQASLRLEEVWCLPELKATKLVSIVCLGDYSIRVIFESGRTVEAYKEGKLIFTVLQPLVYRC